MDFTPDKGSSSDEDFSNTRNAEKLRHSPEQTQHLEKYFMVYTNPTEEQRDQLARDLGLAPGQVRFRFQNKRKQIRNQSDKASNIVLRKENARILSENLSLKEMLNYFCCPRCNGFTSNDDVVKQLALERLRVVNTLLKQKYQRLIANIIATFEGKPRM